MSNLSAEQRLTRATVWLMSSPNYAIFSGLYTMGKVEVKDDIPTACTNGRDEFYGRKFIESLPDEEVRGVKLHETWHKAACHLTLLKYLMEKDARTANQAMDYVINLFIKDSDPSGNNVRLPSFALLDERFRGMDVAEVFDVLTQEKKNGQDKGGKGTPSDGDEEGDGHGDPLDAHDWEGAQALSDEEKQQLAEDVDSALRQGALIAGKLGGKQNRAIEDMLAPKVNWDDEMREFVTALCSGHDLPSYRKPNRRYMGSSMILPSHVSEKVGKLVVGIDASGSIWGDVLNTFLSTFKDLCDVVNPESVELLYWDTEVAGHETYDEGSYAGILTSTKPKGGGGTSPQCVVDYMQAKGIRPECVVMLTDGYVDGWGEGWAAPVLWCITDKRNRAPVGKSVHIDV